MVTHLPMARTKAAQIIWWAGRPIFQAGHAVSITVARSVQQM
jgi:hypothetical protein